VGLVLLPFITSTPAGAAVIGLAGIALGFGNLHGMTWTQTRVAPALMGRVMSVMIMGSVGLVPVSMLIAGAVVQVSLDGMLVVAGIGMAVLCAGSLLSPAVRHMGLEPPFEAVEGETGEGFTASGSDAAQAPA
jgi:hypothetical protein